MTSGSPNFSEITKKLFPSQFRKRARGPECYYPAHNKITETTKKRKITEDSREGQNGQNESKRNQRERGLTHFKAEVTLPLSYHVPNGAKTKTLIPSKTHVNEQKTWPMKSPTCNKKQTLTHNLHLQASNQSKTDVAGHHPSHSRPFSYCFKNYLVNVINIIGILNKLKFTHGLVLFLVFGCKKLSSFEGLKKLSS